MSVLQVSNIHFETTGTNRLEYDANNNINFITDGGNFTVSVGGAESLNVNASSVMISGANILASVASAWGTANAALANTDATFSGNLTLDISRTLFVGNATVNTAISAGSITTNGVALDIGRNRIINGAMEIDQRNAGVVVSAPPHTSYTLDRFRTITSGGGVYSVQQIDVADITMPAGFKNALKVKLTTKDSSIAAGDIYSIEHLIEGSNITDLDWGLSTAKTITMSFWIRATVAGTYGGVLRNSTGSRSYPYSYTINDVDTWEYKTITIAGDTTGTWLTTTGIGVRVGFDLGSGTTYQGTAGAWAATNVITATGSTQFIGGTVNDTFYITGIQFEVGSVATPFERRQYGQELMLCKRYYQIGSAIMDCAVNSTTTVRQHTTPLEVEMRGTPTLVTSGTNGSPTVTASNKRLAAYSTATTTYMAYSYQASAEL